VLYWNKPHIKEEKVMSKAVVINHNNLILLEEKKDYLLYIKDKQHIYTLERIVEADEYLYIQEVIHYYGQQIVDYGAENYQRVPLKRLIFLNKESKKRTILPLIQDIRFSSGIYITEDLTMSIDNTVFECYNECNEPHETRRNGYDKKEV
jgi:hypothetical protein